MSKQPSPIFLKRIKREDLEQTETQEAQPKQLESKPKKRFAIMRYIEFAAVLVGLLAFLIDLSDREQFRAATAWQVLAIDKPGNSGTIQAIEYLNSKSCWRGYDSGCSFMTFKDRYDLTGIELQPHSVMYGVDLYRAELSASNLRKIDFQRANLEGAYFVDANLEGTYFANTNLKGANFLSAKLAGAIFIQANLSRANLEANLANANFYHAILKGADLEGAWLRGAYFRGAVIKGANLMKAHLQGAIDLTCSQLMESINWQTTYRDPELACGAPIPKPPENEDY